MKDCPDLTKLSVDQKIEFWQSADPRELKRLGDRLLAESLPHYCSSRPRELISQDVAKARESLGWSLEQISEILGVTPDLLSAWEEDRVKPPECLPLILERLAKVSVA